MDLIFLFGNTSIFYKGAEWNQNFMFGFELETLKMINQRRL